MHVTKEFIYQFINQQRLGVVATTNPENKPEAAVVGIAVSENLEIIFDTVEASRKYANILHNPAVAVVIGWDDEITVQYEGTAEILGDGDEADSLRAIYYQAYPDGQERTATWPGLVHIKITPRWIRYSNFNLPFLIEELSFSNQ
jgi:general stress protein 26